MHVFLPSDIFFQNTFFRNIFQENHQSALLNILVLHGFLFLALKAPRKNASEK